MKFAAAFLTIGLLAASVQAQPMATGTLVSVSGQAHIKRDNDQAVVSFFVEEQDKDKTAAASRVNQKMKSGTELIKKEDPEAQLTTRAYYSYPVYADETGAAPALSRKRQLTGWRIGQYLEVKTQNLKQLPATTAAVQKILALNGIRFGLSDAAAKDLEAERLEAGYKNFTEKVKIITRAMGRKEADVAIESIDFEDADNAPIPYASEAPMLKSAARTDAAVAEPSFEPGVTSITVRVNGKIRMK
ncbi:MAG: SIMPL domain-containing protein [Burkholderiales bacterium]|nr:SIMPL domain-containing protein [Burkholderiales bacterium]